MHNFGIDGFQASDLHVEKYPQTKTIYDTKGNVVEEITFSRNGNIESRIVHTFDENGYLAEELYYSEDELTDRLTFERQADGRIIKEFKHYLDGSYDTVFHTYDPSGRLIGEETFDEDGLVESKTIIEYDDSRLVSEKVFDGEGELTMEKNNRYDEQGHLIEQAEWNRSDDILLRTVDEYSEDGVRIRSSRYRNRKLTERFEFTYGEEGRVDRMTEENERGSSTYSFVYDHIGNLLIQEEVNRAGITVSKIERLYDGAGRIVESQVFIDGLGRRMSQYYRLEYVYEFMDETSV